jgi:hypothetical protein
MAILEAYHVWVCFHYSRFRRACMQPLRAGTLSKAELQPIFTLKLEKSNRSPSPTFSLSTLPSSLPDDEDGDPESGP